MKKLDKLFNCMTNELDKTVDEIMDLYDKEDGLSLLRSPALIFSYEFEIISLMLHVTDFTLFCLHSKQREEVMHYFLHVEGESINLSTFCDTNISARTVLDERMQTYAMVVQGISLPHGSWFPGEVKDDPFFQVLLLLGDYITYYQKLGKLPLASDVRSVLLLDILDHVSDRMLGISWSIFRIISPHIKTYQDVIIRLYN